MPRTPPWLRDHAHEHPNRYPEHFHNEEATPETIDQVHAYVAGGEPPSDWREAHPHAHVGGWLEHQHPEGQTDDEEETQHGALDSDSFNQGPGANRAMDGGPATEADLTARGQPSNGHVAQTGFGDHVVNVEDEEGEKFLALLDERSEIKALATRWSAVNLDIKKQLSNRGIPSGDALRVRVGAHILNFSDKSEDKNVEAKTRAGSQRLSIVHPE